MKITPLEIRQKTFEKGFRGYEKDEVHAFLQSLSQEWEKLMDENKELRIKMEGLEKEVEKLRQVESSLYKTLKTAEDTGANIMDQATKMAELHMKETEMKAEAILNDAKNKSRDTIEEAEMVARQTIEDMESQLKNLIHTFKTLENFRDDLIADIKGMSTDALERVERIKDQIKRVDIEGEFMQARRESKKKMEDRLNENDKAKRQQMEVSISVDSEGISGKKSESEPPVNEQVTKEAADESPAPVEESTTFVESESKKEDTQKKSGDSSGSFFDEIQ